MQISNGSDREMNHCYYLKGTMSLFSSPFCRLSNSCQHIVNLQLCLKFINGSNASNCMVVQFQIVVVTDEIDRPFSDCYQASQVLPVIHGPF